MLLVTKRTRVLAHTTLWLMVGCAPMIVTEPAAMKQIAADAHAMQIQLRQSVNIMLTTQYARTLPEGSRWRRVGALTQGDVYRPVDTVFTIEGRQVHEAYLVIASGVLVGFYLPGESNFSPIPNPLPLSFGEIK